MASLKVIRTGFGRTGTDSMREALGEKVVFVPGEPFYVKKKYPGLQVELFLC